MSKFNNWWLKQKEKYAVIIVDNKDYGVSEDGIIEYYDINSDGTNVASENEYPIDIGPGGEVVRQAGDYDVQYITSSEAITLTKNYIFNEGLYDWEIIQVVDSDNNVCLEFDQNIDEDDFDKVSGIFIKLDNYLEVS